MRTRVADTTLAGRVPVDERTQESTDRGIGIAIAPGRALSRRLLLRRALTAGVGVAVTGVLVDLSLGRTAPAAATSGGRPAPPEPAAAPPSATAGDTRSIPQELEVIPPGYASPAEEPGALVELDYDTYESMTYEQGTQRLTKRAIVYLPYGYTEDARYDVFYLMHGGWGDETTTLGTPGSPSTLKHVLDNAIAAGEIGPLIVVAPTYNNTSPDDSASFGLALTLTENYHRELLNDLIPAVESRYSTYARDVTPTGLEASRDHRGFGGFSMGAVTTWRTFQFGLDHFRWFLPMSCGTSLDMDNIIAAAGTHDRSDFFVWIITGTEDFALPYEEARVTLLQASPYFTEADNEQDGNFAFRVKEGYAHDGVAATEYTYNGLRWFWGG